MDVASCVLLSEFADGPQCRWGSSIIQDVSDVELKGSSLSITCTKACRTCSGFCLNICCPRPSLPPSALGRPLVLLSINPGLHTSGCSYHTDLLAGSLFPVMRESSSLRQFHLKRFEYDPYRDDLAKIHDRLEFPTELDMSPWVDGDGGGDHDDDDDAASRGSTLKDAASHEYHLSAVVMHVGGPAAGHYYAYVRAPSEVKVALKGKETKKCTKWVKLDDQRVTEVSEAEVLRDAFGGGGGVYRGPGGQGLLGQVSSCEVRGVTWGGYIIDSTALT